MDSPMQQWYRGKSVLVTGGTGALGKVLVEKLLYTCPSVGRIYLLVREKNNQDVKARLHALLKDKIFRRLIESGAEIAGKLTVVQGDLQKERLGMIDEVYQQLTQEVEVVLHAAATVRFNETLDSALRINLAGTRTVCLLAQDMPKLQAFVYVSTAFSNCDRELIEEKVCPSSKFTPEQLLEMMKELNDRQLLNITPSLLGSKPNTYVLTKCAAEEVVKRFKSVLPAAIIRPSIVGACMTEPEIGWVDSYNGVTPYILAVLMGSLRAVHCHRKPRANIVPLDYTANAVLALAFARAHDHKLFNTRSEDVPVVNFVTSRSNSVRWEQFINLTLHLVHENPSHKLMWYPFVIITSSLWLLLFLHFWLHLLPSYAVDLFMPGSKFSFRKNCERVKSYLKSVNYFCTREFQFEEENCQLLWETLSSQDKQLFPFNMADLDWEQYYRNYVRGCKQFLLQESPLPTVRAVNRLNKLYCTHMAVLMLLLIIFIKIMYWTMLKF